MSWADPCSKCGEHRADCSCPIEPYTKEQLQKHSEDKAARDRARKEVCNIIGHDYRYTFIVCSCSRCGDTTEP